MVRNLEARGSIPLRSTIKAKASLMGGFAFNMQAMGVRTPVGSGSGCTLLLHPENRSQGRGCVGAADRRSLTAGYPPTLKSTYSSRHSPFSIISLACSLPT